MSVRYIIDYSNPYGSNSVPDSQSIDKLTSNGTEPYSQDPNEVQSHLRYLFKLNKSLKSFVDRAKTIDSTVAVPHGIEGNDQDNRNNLLHDSLSDSNAFYITFVNSTHATIHYGNDTVEVEIKDTKLTEIFEPDSFDKSHYRHLGNVCGRCTILPGRRQVQPNDSELSVKKPLKRVREEPSQSLQVLSFDELAEGNIASELTQKKGASQSKGSSKEAISDGKAPITKKLKSSLSNPWIVIRNISQSLSYMHLERFFSGIKFLDVYCIPNFLNDQVTTTMTIYIEFHNVFGAETALRRSGEGIIITENQREIEVSISAHAVTSSEEAAWAKATGYLLNHDVSQLSKALSITSPFITRDLLYIDIERILEAHPDEWKTFLRPDAINSNKTLENLLVMNSLSNKATQRSIPSLYNNKRSLVINSMAYSSMSGLSGIPFMSGRKHGKNDPIPILADPLKTIQAIQAARYDIFLDDSVSRESRDIEYVFERLERLICIFRILSGSGA